MFALKSRQTIPSRSFRSWLGLVQDLPFEYLSKSSEDDSDIPDTGSRCVVDRAGWPGRGRRLFLVRGALLEPERADLNETAPPGPIRPSRDGPQPKAIEPSFSPGC